LIIINFQKRFKKCIVIAVVVVTLVFIVNIVLAIFFQGDSGANIFTTISGWISGISTIVITRMCIFCRTLSTTITTVSIILGFPLHR